MKKIFLITFCFLFLGKVSAQQNAWKDFYIYNIKLPDDLNNEPGVYIQILYKNESLLSTQKWINKQVKSIATEFTYHETETNLLNNVKLPFALPAKTYTWLINKNIVEEMKKYPNRFQMEIITTGKPIEAYSLPQKFDFYATNALNINQLLLMNESKRKTYIIQKTNILYVQKKEKPVKIIIKDTTLVYSARKDVIPKGIRMVVQDPLEINTIHSTKIFTIEGCYLYKNKLFLPIPNKNIKPHPDQMTDCFTTINGDKCCAFGGITGAGYGECRVLPHIKEAIKYTVEIQIEP